MSLLYPLLHSQPLEHRCRRILNGQWPLACTPTLNKPALPPMMNERLDGYVLCVREKQYRELLGTGSFKSVYKAFDSELGREVAWNQVSGLSSPLPGLYQCLSLTHTLSLVSIPPHLSFSYLLLLSPPPLLTHRCKSSRASSVPRSRGSHRCTRVPILR